MSLDRTYEQDVWAVVTVRGNNARAHRDYGLTKTSIEIPAGETETTVVVPVLDDDKRERDEPCGFAFPARTRGGTVIGATA